MKTLVLVRHGETDWNSDNRVQGSIDVPLSEEGLRQAGAVADAMAARGLRFDRAYTSDLARARRTAEIIGERLAIPAIVESPLLRELHCGLWEGRAIDDLRENDPEGYAGWLDDPDFVIPGGESMHQLFLRACRFLEEQKAALEETRRVLVVAHGLMNRMLLAALLKIEPQRARYFSQDNTAVNLFRRSSQNGRIYCDAWNLNCHLE